MNKIFIALFFVSSCARLHAVDLWQHPEMAEKNSFFIDIASPYASLNDGFDLLPPVFNADFMLPLFLPVSAGVFFKTPDPNLKSFGLRAAYHINLNSPKTDIYFLYVFDFGFLRNDLLLEYNDDEQELKFYDFRFGIRRGFSSFLCLFLESDYKLQGFYLGLSLKLF